VNRYKATFRSLLGIVAAALACAVSAQTLPTTPTVKVTRPNGFATLSADDLVLQSTAGPMRWMRVWNGQEWQFNPHWESLSQSWKNLTGSQAADTSGSTLSSSGGGGALTSGGSGSSGGGGDGCWVWVDEDWQPTVGTTVVGGLPAASPLIPLRSTPFNRTIGEQDAAAALNYPPRQIVNIDYAGLCMGAMLSTGSVDFEAIRRQNELYLGDGSRYAFDNRTVLEKRPVRELPRVLTTPLAAQLATGRYAVSPITNPKGYRWSDRTGDWIEYNTQGQVVAYGDTNNNTIWLARDLDGKVHGVVDANGRVLLSLHYTGSWVTEVRDYPIAGMSEDLPQRVVKYEYDSKNRISAVTDARGYQTKFEYDLLNNIVKITDAEQRVQELQYNGVTVAKHIAADLGVTDYAFDYDDVNKQFNSRITGPETSPGRRVENLTHNRVGKLVRQTLNGRTDQEVRYDTGARAELRTNARGFTTRLVRNEFDQVVRVEYADGSVATTSHSAVHLMAVEEIDEAGVKTLYERDNKGSLLKKTEAAGLPEQRVTEYIVNPLGQTTRVTRKGRTELTGTVTPDTAWQIDYDDQGQIRQITDPENNVLRYTFDRAGNLVRATDGREHSTRYIVDAHGDLTQVLDALNRQWHYAYDKVGNLKEAKDARGKSTLYAYDAMNRRKEATNAVSGSYRIQYNGQGLPTAETDEDGRTVESEFDTFLRLTSQADALGNKTEYGYTLPDGSQAGLLGSISHPTEIKYPTFTQRLRLDERERLTSETLLNPNSQGTEGLVSGTDYDKRGLVTSETDANGKTRFTGYDALRQPISFKDSLGHETKADYDARGNLIRITDAKNNATRFEIDKNDRITREIQPLGQTTQYHYDAAGNLRERIDANGNKTEFVYDAANRLQELKRYKGIAQLVRTTGFTLDNEDQLTAWTDTDFTRPPGQQATSGTAAYDDAGRKTSESVELPDPAGGTTRLSYAYEISLAGYKTKLTWPDGTAIGYSYSEHGELQSVTIPGEGSISVNDYKWLAPAKTTLPGGTTQETTLDGLLNLEALKVKAPSQQTVLQLVNTYGKVQELKTRTRTDSAGEASSSRSSSFGYDDEIRLTEVATDAGGLFGNDIEAFTLDALGNRIAHSKVAGAWAYDANNRLMQRGTGADATSYDYDEVGNLTQKTEAGVVTTYGYDTQNRMTEVRRAGQLLARYGYDPMDRRVWKEQYRDRQGNPSAQAKRTVYLYADEGLIAEATQDITLNADQTVSAGSAPQITTQYGPRPDAEFTTGVLFAKTRNSNGEPVFAYYHRDHLETPIQATDKQGRVVWAANYNVFGQATITTPAASADKPTIQSNLRLPGQIEDQETGLHYNYRRYYDPQTGRYVTQDPIGLEGGINLYRYANADPVNLTDPTGEILPQAAAFAACMGACALETAAENFVTGECTNWGSTATDCAVGCAAGMGLGWAAGKAWSWLRNGYQWWKNRPCALSFPGETLVHVRPDLAREEDAYEGLAILKPIRQLQVGDEVLAFSEWKGQERGDARTDRRLSYEKIVDVYSSYRTDVVMHLTLDDGDQIRATASHPFMTSEGWRDAGKLARGQMLLKKLVGDQNEPTTSTIVDITAERQTLTFVNLEVANAHTYFVGYSGDLVHNGCKRIPMSKHRKAWEKLHNEPWPKTAEGKNYHGHHKDALTDGGTDTVDNIVPKHPSDHRRDHMENGDFKRWGKKGKP
jgi:RHS repeat-associated protein